MGDIKVTYFPIKALAEPIRMLLKYGGINFNDDRFDRTNWPQLKPNMPFGQVPVYEEGGKVAHQSVAIARYVAKKVKLAGDTDWENLEIDSIVDTINDFRTKIGQYHYEADAETKAKRKETLFTETLPFYLDRLDAIAAKNGGHFALNKLTWADIFFVGLIDYMNFMAGVNLLEKHSNLQKIVNDVSSIPTIKAWIEERPKTEN